MPDKPAQHGPRTWFEEPPRPEHATRTGGGAAGQGNSTQLPGSGVENGGDGNAAAPARPTARTESEGSAVAGSSAADAGSEPPRERDTEASAPAGPGTPSGAETENDGATESAEIAEPESAEAKTDSPTAPVEAASVESAPGESASVESAPVESAGEETGAGSDVDPDAATDALASPVESTEADTERLMVPGPAESAGAGAESTPPDPAEADATDPLVVPPGAEASAPTEQHTSGDNVSPHDRSPERSTMDDAVTAVIPVVPAAPNPAEPVTRPRVPQPPSAFDAAATTEIPRIQHAPHSTGWHPSSPGGQQPVTDSRSGQGPGGRPPGGGGTLLGDQPPFVRHSVLIAAVVLGVLLLGYVVDVASSRGEVPRGVTVAGVDIGGLERTAAEQRLRQQIEPRLTRPITLLAGDADVRLDPDEAGLSLDWPATLDAAGEQPLNPWTRFISLFAHREVGVVTTGDRDTITAALEDLRSTIDRESIEGTIRFEGAAPIPVDPIPGQRLVMPAAVDVLLDEWIRGDRVRLPVETLEVSTTPEGVRAALTEFVEPAVSDEVTVRGDGVNAVLDPRVTADALIFEPDDAGGLSVTIDNEVVIDALSPRLSETEQEARDASVVIEGGQPRVLPSAQGRSIDWEESLAPLPDVLRTTGSQRTLSAVYSTESPDLTTEQARQLGITTEISSFTTGGFAADSGENIRRAAEQVNGAIVRPGETFSLNGHTGPRNAASGYKEAGIIQDGRPARGIGGGVSQFATTLFNASYFAGMVDVEHREHSYYISRYPMAREATVYEGAIDVKFRNDSSTGVLIQTEWTPSEVTVTFWGTKHVEVESITGERTDFTEPSTRRINDDDCISTNGSPGFTVTDTRVIRDADSGAEIARNTRTVVYNPQPKIVCE